MADGIPKYGEPLIGEETTEEWVVPATGAGVMGLAAYEISEESPEIAAGVAGLGGLWFLKMR